MKVQSVRYSIAGTYTIDTSIKLFKAKNDYRNKRPRFYSPFTSFLGNNNKVV